MKRLLKGNLRAISPKCSQADEEVFGIISNQKKQSKTASSHLLPINLAKIEKLDNAKCEHYVRAMLGNRNPPSHDTRDMRTSTAAARSIWNYFGVRIHEEIAGFIGDLYISILILSCLKNWPQAGELLSWERCALRHIRVWCTRTRWAAGGGRGRLQEATRVSSHGRMITYAGAHHGILHGGWKLQIKYIYSKNRGKKQNETWHTDPFTKNKKTFWRNNSTCCKTHTNKNRY